MASTQSCQFATGRAGPHYLIYTKDRWSDDTRLMCVVCQKGQRDVLPKRKRVSAQVLLDNTCVGVCGEPDRMTPWTLVTAWLMIRNTKDHSSSTFSLPTIHTDRSSAWAERFTGPINAWPPTVHLILQQHQEDGKSICECEEPSYMITHQSLHVHNTTNYNQIFKCYIKICNI